jgi:hypothetical protein
MAPAHGAMTSESSPEVYFDLGENTILFLLFHGRGRRSGAEVAMPVALLARWREGLIVYTRSYADREDALSHLGVSEDRSRRDVVRSTNRRDHSGRGGFTSAGARSRARSRGRPFGRSRRAPPGGA